MEALNTDICTLKYETKIYQYLNGTLGVPILKWYGCDQNYRYMVINLLKLSLSDLIDQNHYLSLQNTLEIGIYIIQILKSIHEKGLIHRDIKPNNFLFGTGDNQNKLYLIDYGMCKKYVTNTGDHILPKNINNILGSLNYCSINNHNLIEPSRRDDLESVGYILIYLLNGNLIWEKIRSPSIIKERKEVLTKDIKIPGIHDIIITYLKYIRGLEFSENPNYDWIIELFSSQL